MKHTRVLVVDDHEQVRQGLRAFLRSLPNVEWVGEASDGAEALQQCAALAPDIVLMDVMMPQMDGVEATHHIHQYHPHTRVIGLSSSQDEQSIKDMMRAGAVGYIFKSGTYEELASVLGAVHQEASQPLVLVAEDDPHLRGLFSKILKKAGFQVNVAVNGQDVLDQLQTRPPEVLVLDLGMPELSGFDLIQYIREDLGNQDVHIVVVTGNHRAEEHAEAAAVDLFLIKPISPQDLVNFVQRFLGRDLS